MYICPNNFGQLLINPNVAWKLHKFTSTQQQPIHEVHYIQEPFMESVTIDENGAPAVIHYIQLQDPTDSVRQNF